MIMKTKFNFYMVMALCLICLYSCSKDDEDNNGTSPEVASLEIAQKVNNIQVPEVIANSDHEYAQQVTGYVDMIHDIGSFFTYFEPPDDAQVIKEKSTVDEETYYWTDGVNSIWMTYYESSENYHWDVDVDFGEGRTPYIRCEEMKDGSSGIMNIYSYYEYSGNAQYAFVYQWQIQDDDSVLLELFNNEGGFKLEILGNTNSSGYAKYFIAGELFYEFLWNSDGSGLYKYYSNGEVFMEDNWTVDDL